jgi:hypothetical protein
MTAGDRTYTCPMVTVRPAHLPLSDNTASDAVRAPPLDGLAFLGWHGSMA